MNSKRKAFDKYTKKYAEGGKQIQIQLNRIKKHCTVVRAIIHTQLSLLHQRQKRAHVMEV